MVSHTQLAALACATITLATAGCGGSSKGTALSSAELIAKADAICAHVHAEYHANGYTTTQSIARLAPRVASDEQVGVAELRRLIPPASMASDWKELVDNAETVADDTSKLGRYAKEDNLKAATSLFTVDRQREQQALAIAARDGFRQCAQAS
jgi:hypothetical protein